MGDFPAAAVHLASNLSYITCPLSLSPSFSSETNLLLLLFMVLTLVLMLVVPVPLLRRQATLLLQLDPWLPITDSIPIHPNIPEISQPRSNE